MCPTICHNELDETIDVSLPAQLICLVKVDISEKNCLNFENFTLFLTALRCSKSEAPAATLRAATTSSSRPWTCRAWRWPPSTKNGWASARRPSRTPTTLSSSTSRASGSTTRCSSSPPPFSSTWCTLRWTTSIRPTPVRSVSALPLCFAGVRSPSFCRLCYPVRARTTLGLICSTGHVFFFKDYKFHGFPSLCLLS